MPRRCLEPGMRRAPTMFRRRHRGCTMLELPLVALLRTLIVAFLSATTRWYPRSVKDMHVVAQLDESLKLASMTIAQDYGSCIAARTTDGSNLQLDFDDGDGVAQWDAP